MKARRVVNSVLLGAALCSALAAQADNPGQDMEDAITDRIRREVLTRLRSDKLTDAAWGGYLVGRYMITDAAPHVLQRLRRLKDVPYKEGRFAVAALLDGLVRIGAKAKPEEIRPFLTGIHYAPAFVLLARQPVASRALLAAIYKTHDVRQRRHLLWQACGNLLTTARAPGFAGRLLGAMRFRLDILVTDPGAFGGIAVDHGLSGSHGDGIMLRPEGYPPTPVYDLSDRADAGHIVLAPGKRPVYYTREERPERRFGYGSSNYNKPRDPYRMDWLAGLLQKHPERFGLKLETTAEIPWSGAKDYLEAATAERKAVTGAFAKVVATLRTKKLLTANEARVLTPHVTVAVHDQRKKKEPPLPELKE